MTYPSRVLLILLCSLFLVNFVTPPAETAPPAPKSTALAAASDFISLPARCVGGLPPGDNVPVCCMFGYVFIDGQAVANAQVIITNLRTGDSTEVWTADGPDSDQPYYALSLSDTPLNAVAGDTIGIYVWYSDHEDYQTYTVQGGGQQVDVVLARTAGTDYVFERQFWAQSTSGSFNMYRGDIVIDGSDTIYVADWSNARIQVFNHKKEFVRQWGTLGLGPDQFQNPSGITVDRFGNIYVADSGTHYVKKFTSAGEWLATWGGAGTANGEFGYPRDIVTDNDGYVYVTDVDNNRIQKFTSNGAFVATWGTQGSTNGQLRYPEGLALGPDGLLYVADAGNNRIQVFTRNGSFIRAWGSLGNGNGQFDRPERVAVADNGNVYVSDANSEGSGGNDRIQVFSSTGTYLNQWGQYGQQNGQFYKPGGIAFDSEDHVYVADAFNQRVQVFGLDGSYRDQWGHEGDADTKLFSPNGVALDSAGNLYVAETNRGYIKKFDPTGAFLSIIGQPGDGDGQLSAPAGIAVDASNRLYVADTGNRRIQIFSTAGSYLDQWGTEGDGDGQFREPIGVAADNNGSVYVVDSGNHRIQKFTSTGVFQWKVGGPLEGTGNNQFTYPRSIAADTNGNVYVADTDNQRIQKFSSAGTYLGGWGSEGTSDGEFQFPAGIAVDNAGTVYVTDFGNYRFQRFTNTGTWLSRWGTPGAASGQFILPTRIAVGSDGRVYISERELGRVQILRPITSARPIATIVATGPRTITAGQPIELQGMGSVSVPSATIVAYEWSLDDAPFATGATATLVTASNIFPGQHRISLRVRDSTNAVSDPVTVSLTVARAAPQTPPTTWTMLLYLDGDNTDIAAFLNADSPGGALYRLQHSSSSSIATIVALYDGDQAGGGDSYRYIIGPSGMFEVFPAGEVNMGDPQTLIDFVAWGKQVAPADAYYLAIADHGNGIDGIAWDITSAPNLTERLTNTELRQALVVITGNGTHPIDVLHLDACLMGLVENAYQLRGMARYLIVSENLSWSAFAYDSYHAAMGSNTTPETLAKTIVDRYAQIISERRYPLTISALDMGKIDAVTLRVNDLAKELQLYAFESQQNRDTLAALRTQVQKFDSDGDRRIAQDDEYVDLVDWARLVQQHISTSTVQSAAANVQTAVQGLILNEHHISGKIGTSAVNVDNAHGLAIYYPPEPGARTYQIYRNDLDFATVTLWDEFLQAGLASLPVVPPPDPNPIPPISPYQNSYLPLMVR